jgi:tRNA-(guanine-N1)-methyltransferase
VPEVLFSGHHEKIRQWRREQQLLSTLERRPDLLRTAPLDGEERALLERLAAKWRSP